MLESCEEYTTYESHEIKPTRARKAKAPVDFGTRLCYVFLVVLLNHNDSIDKFSSKHYSVVLYITKGEARRPFSPNVEV